HGWHYIATFLLKDNLSRYTEPVWGPRRGIFFYFPVLLGDMFPWSVFLIAAFGFQIANFRLQAFRSTRHSDEKQAHTWMLLWIWIAVIVGFYSLSRNKEDLYILPVYTATAALVGNTLANFTAAIRNQSVRNRVLRWTTAILALLLIAIGAGALYLFGNAASGYRLAGAKAIGYMALAGGIVALAMALMKRDFFAVVGTGLAVVAVNWVFVLWTLPDFERFKPARPMCEIISARAAPDALVGYYRFASPSMSFYLRRPIFEYYDPQELASALASGREVYCLMEYKDYEVLRRSHSGPIYILASRPIFQVKLRSLLDRREPPQVVLISNKKKDGIASQE
ncbi:MAG TPA: hypothetical protein VNO70_08970, partial [Blastocatellia bacterium]|nr:hypothetical protein [Blastocatellia bacterium]